MGSINQNYKEGLEQHKGKILGFDKNKMAVYSGDGVKLCAVDTCECCGQIINSHICQANFCPICSMLLGITTKDFVVEYCEERYIEKINNFEDDIEYRLYMVGLTQGFKKGMQFAVNNAKPSLQYVVSFDYQNC